MSKLWIVVVVVLIALGFGVRLYKFSEPVADWHSHRQSDTAAVGQIFSTEGYNLLFPKYFDISNIQSSEDNPEGYRFVEFPLYNALHAFLFNTVGIISFVEWGRLINIIASLITSYIIFLLMRKYVGRWGAVGSLAAFLFLPFSIFYSRVILPDVLMTTSILAGIYFFDKWIEQVKTRRSLVYFFLSVLFLALSFLFKPFALFFTLPILYLIYKHFRFSAFKKWELWVYAVLTLVPLILWRLWIGQYPEGIAASTWLFNEGGIRFKGAFFYWLFAERISKLILGYFGVVLVFIGLLKLPREKDYLFFVSFLISTFLYISVIARGNVQHDYYQILIIPTLVIFFGRGIEFLLRFEKGVNRFIGVGIVVVVFMFACLFSWYHIRDYFNINNRALVNAGMRADALLPHDALVIAPYGGDTTFLNHIKRRGWPAFTYSIEELMSRGANYLVLVTPSDEDRESYPLRYELIEMTDEYLIVKLQ